jgi:hypothetical protein
LKLKRGTTISASINYGLFILCFSAQHCGADIGLQATANHITKTIFGTKSLGISLSEQNKIEDLIYHLISVPRYQRYLVAQRITPKLEQELHQTKQLIEKMNATHTKIPYSLFYKEFLLQQQINHFKDHLTYNAHDINLWEIMRYNIRNAYQSSASRLLSLIGTYKKEDSTNQLVDQVLNYITFERETILFDYDKLLTFLLIKQKVQLPMLINFWDTPEVMEKLKKRAKLIKTEEVKIQAVELLVSFAIQSLVMAGGQAAIQILNDEGKVQFDNLQKQQAQTNADMATFQNKLKTDQEAAITSIELALSDSQATMNKEYAKNNTLLQRELSYLNQSINLAKPLARYLNNPVPWDEYFERAPMFAPAPYSPWYNIFNKGDWQFDVTTNSFWQNSLIPFPKLLYWNKENGDVFADDPAANSIFTEYITRALSYDIEVECSLITCTYPFFAGIMFNRGRWLSGDPERIWWYRLLGLYGTESTPGNPQTRAINLSFAQQQLIPKTGTVPEKIISPLEQIMSNKTTPISYQLPTKDTKSLERNPIIFQFNITTNPGSITFTLSKKEKNVSTGKETSTELYSGTATNLKSYISMFHGIGFMAAGCQAEFKIIKPEQLVVNSEQRATFKQTLATTLQLK